MLRKIKNFIAALKRTAEIICGLADAIKALSNITKQKPEEKPAAPEQPSVTVNFYFQDRCQNTYN